MNLKVNFLSVADQKSELSLQNFTQPEVFAILNALDSEITSLLSIVKKGAKLAHSAGSHEVLVSALHYLGNSLNGSGLTRDILNLNTDDAGVRSHYAREIAKCYLDSLNSPKKDEFSVRKVRSFLKGFEKTFAYVGRRESELALETFTEHGRSFCKNLARINSLCGLEIRHAEFKELVKVDVQHLRPSVSQSSDIWKVRCFDDPRAFQSKFPTANEQEDAIARLRELSVEAACKRLVS